MKNNDIKRTIIIYLLAGIGLPFLLKYLIFENQALSNLTNNEWAGFLGSYAGGILGGLGTLISVVFTVSSSFNLQKETERENKKNEKMLSAAILYHDIKSIERYIKEDYSHINIRYSSDWQSMIAKCFFLNDKQVEWLYMFYNEVYNFNYQFSLKEKEDINFDNDDIVSYGTLSKIIFIDGNRLTYTTDYSNLMVLLSKEKSQHNSETMGA